MSADFALTRTEMIRLVALGVAADWGHTVAVVDEEPQPAPSTLRLAETLLDGYVVARPLDQKESSSSDPQQAPPDPHDETGNQVAAAVDRNVRLRGRYPLQ